MLAKKVEVAVEGKNTFVLSYFPFDFFYRVFGRFSARGAQKHQNNLSKTRPKNPKIWQQNLKKRSMVPI
jgi:hypothetical protein